MSVLSYFQIFASYWCSTVLYFLPGIISYRQYAMIIATLSILLTLRQFSLRSFRVPKKYFFFVCAFLLCVILFSVTPQIYGSDNVTHSSFFLVLAGQVLPIVIMVPFVSNNHVIEGKIKKITPIISLIFTVIAFFGTFRPTSKTGGGFAYNDNGLTYQTASYLAAYAAGLAEYYLLCKKEIEWHRIFRSSVMGIIMSIIIIINAISILVSGGRGGLVVYLIEIIVILFYWIRKNQINSNKILKIALVVGAIFGIGYFALRFASKADIATSGFNRFINTFTKGDQSGRNLIMKHAFESFLKSPIWGHGFGSVFYELNRHSHNLFFDVMVETGIVGLVIWVIFLASTIHKLIIFERNDVTESLWTIIFLDGMIMSLFSGYYLAQLPLLWVMVYVYFRDKKDSRIVEHDNKG